MTLITAGEIARHLQGVVIGNPSLELKGFAAAPEARAGDLTFAENAAFFRLAEGSAASAVLVDGPFESKTKTLIRVASARVAFARVLPLFFPEPTYPAQVHPTAILDPGSRIDPSAHVGPFCVVKAGVTLGPRVVLMGSNHIGEGCQIGEDSRLYPQVTLYARSQVGRRVCIHAGAVIGSDGFGYVLDQGQHCKVPQVGWVVIEDDVEIGANVTIDRGALGATVIGRGTKIDNLVQVAHNVEIGEHCLLISQVGIAGSTKLGQYVTLAGQVGVAGHLRIGNRVVVAAQSGVMHHIPEGQKWMGSPAQPDRQAKRQLIAAQQFPELKRRLLDLEKRVGRPAGPSASTNDTKGY